MYTCFWHVPTHRRRFLQIDRKIRPLPYIGVDLCQNVLPYSRPKVKFMIREFHVSCKKRVHWGCFDLRRPLQPTRYPESPDVRWWVLSGMWDGQSRFLSLISYMSYKPNTAHKYSQCHRKNNFGSSNHGSRFSTTCKGTPSGQHIATTTKHVFDNTYKHTPHTPPR